MTPPSALLTTRVVALVLAALALTSLAAGPSAGPSTGRGGDAVPLAVHPWGDASLPPQERTAMLLARMTLDDKIAQVHGVGYPDVPDPDVTYAGAIPANPRLGIPAVYLADSPLGVGNASTGVTQWPDTTALASTWDTALAHDFGRAYGAEQAGKGHNVALGPTINVLRLPVWGRAPETFSEDPYLTARQAAAEITGIQSQHVMATAKHFVANNQEYQRGSVDVDVSDKARMEIYQPAFKAAVDAGVGAVMCSYNKIGGTYACENADELVGVLRDAWKFDGMVMSDWGAVHSTVGSATSGLDLEMPGADDDSQPGAFDALLGSYFNSRLRAAIEAGTVTVAQLDRMVGHVLTAMFRIGLFDHPVPDPLRVKDTVVSTPEHQALSTRIAEQGAVLLKNASGALPLASEPAGPVASIAVIGDAAEHPVTGGGGSAAVTPSVPVVTPLAGIRSRAGADTEVTYSRGTLGTDPLTPVPASAFGSGLTATYHRGADLSGAVIGRETVADLDLTGNPKAVGPTRDWSARYTGTLTAPASGTYRFSLQAGADVAVFIDDVEVVTFAPVREPTQDGIVDLAAGEHRIRVDVTPYQRNLVTIEAFALTAGLHLGWQPQQERLVADAVAAARAADVAVVVASAPSSEGWDRSTLALPADQDRLIAAVAAANPRTVVVLDTGGAVLMPWLSEVAAVLEVWLPGQTAGTAIARLLFGDVDPGGRLPVTFPASDEQGPARTPAEYPGDGTTVAYDEGTLVGYRWYDAKGQEPLFPFGFGLSYTTFRLSPMTVETTPDGWRVSADVTNTGTRAGTEVVQLYLAGPPQATEAPRQLRGWSKVTLDPGRTAAVHLDLPRSALLTWDERSSAWTTRTGPYDVLLGTSSRDLPLRASISP